MRKIPFQVHLDPPTDAWLRKEASAREVGLGELIRIAIKELRERVEAAK